MQIYQDLTDLQKVLFRRRVSAFLTLADVFVLVLIASYGVSFWKDVKDIRGESRLEIAVTGEGRASMQPDVAKISATVLVENESLKTAQAESSRKTGSLVDYLKKQGIEGKDIKTTGYNIYPQYSYPRPCYGGACPLEENRPRIIGYQVRTTYEITVRDVSKAGDILGGAVDAGANEVGGITFTIDDPDELRAKARTKAVENAREKAEKLAKDLGKRVGRIVNFSESGGYFPPIMFREAALGKGGGGAGPVPAPAVEPGENEVVVNVTIQFEFK